MSEKWKGLPFHPISEFYENHFGSKVYKIPLAIADDCPNRRGLKGMKPCIFCDEWGSAAREEAFSLDLRVQIEKYHDHIQKKFKSENFLAYFQAYTNTFLKIKNLRDHLETALEYPYIKGFVVGTRPDCISNSVLDLWQEMSEKTFVAVELGVQSFFNPQLQFLSRGHTSEDSILAIEKIARNSKVNLGIHLIFGCPNESIEEVIKTAQICNKLPISNVKLHHLHVLKNTPLEEIYKQGHFEPISFKEYAEKVKIFLEYLSPEISVHRLAAYSSRWNDLVAPAWTANKMKTHQEIIDYIRSENSIQGLRYQTKTES